MILKRKIFDLLSNSLNSFLKEMYGDQFGEFVSGYRGLKGYLLLIWKLNPLVAVDFRFISAFLHV